MPAATARSAPLAPVCGDFILAIGFQVIAAWRGRTVVSLPRQVRRPKHALIFMLNPD
jgi:hypothetical protein